MVIVFFIYVLEGNLQWNNWFFKMIDYFKGSIFKFKLNFVKALENKCESAWWWQISSKALVCLGWSNLSIANNLYFQNIILSNILINFDLFPKNDNGYFVAYFDQVYSWNWV